jgi:hypothetical protein
MTQPLYDLARAKGTERAIGQLNPLQRGGEPNVRQLGKTTF